MNKKVTRYFEQRFTTLRDFKLGRYLSTQLVQHESCSERPVTSKDFTIVTGDFSEEVRGGPPKCQKLSMNDA